MTYESLRSVHVPFFFTAHRFTQPPESCALQCFQSARHPRNYTLPWGNLHPHVIHVPLTAPE